MAILGGDDAGGGVIWAPQVIDDASDHGLILSEKGRLYDTKKGQALPPNEKPMPKLTDKELLNYPEPSTSEVVPNHVARYWDMVALSDTSPAKVIGETGMLRDKPGFEVEFLTRNSCGNAMEELDRSDVIMPVRGHWKLIYEGGSLTLNPGDTLSVPSGVSHRVEPAMTGHCSLYRIRATSDPAGSTWKG